MGAKNMSAKSGKEPLGAGARQAGKVGRGRTRASDTPLDVHMHGAALPEALAAYMRGKLGMRLGPFALQIERVTARFEDLNGPRGGVDTECRIQIAMVARPNLVVTERAVDARRAFDGACRSAARAVKHSLDRAGYSVGRGTHGQAGRTVDVEIARSEQNAPPTEGSLIGRRVGRARANLARAAARPEKARRDAHVDTAQPGVSATQRRAGGGSTARRNTKMRTPRAAAALEDSAQPRPSRVSTRKSASGARSGQRLALRAQRDANSPKARAAAARARDARGTH
jgi:hypothetical protein